MQRKGLLVLAIIGGVSIVSLAVAADVVGLGPHGFGLEQKLGVAAGTTVAWFAALRLAGWNPRARRVREARTARPIVAPTA